MTVVVDASVAVRWILPASGSNRADSVLETEDRIVAPDLIIPEIANAIWKAVRFEGLATEVATKAIAEAEKGFHELIPSAQLKDRAMAIAIELRHPAYDCFYLALTERRNAVLITADERLLRRCAKSSFAKLLRAL